ncbi:MAG TPA: DNA glycosylase [Fimbriimonas sp.]|nr:DNA glycosylase [Fimbriimonas sp.]
MTFEIADGAGNLFHIASSGQTFRSTTDGQTVTFRDGSDWYRVTGSDRVWDVESNREEAAVRSYFRLDFDYRAAYLRIVELEPSLAIAALRCSGLRMLRQNSLFEVIVSFLCSPMKSVEVIDQLVCSVARYGEGGFPTPSRLCEVSEQALRLDKLGYRAKSVLATSRLIVDRGGDEYLAALRSMDYASAWRELQTLPGVGRKVADCICLYGLDHQEAVPFDTHVVQVFHRLWPGQGTLNASNARDYLAAGDFMRDKFGDLAGLAQQVMFVDNMERYRGL